MVHSRHNWRESVFDLGWKFGLFCEENVPQCQIQDTDGEVVMKDKLPSFWTLLTGPGELPEAAAASSNDSEDRCCKEERETPLKRCKLTENDAVTNCGKEMMDMRWAADKNSAEATSTMAKYNERGARQDQQ